MNSWAVHYWRFFCEGAPHAYWRLISFFITFPTVNTVTRLLIMNSNRGYGSGIGDPLTPNNWPWGSKYFGRVYRTNSFELAELYARYDFLKGDQGLIGR